MSALPVNIALIRRRWKLSQAAFGNLVGATRTQVSNWERGRTAPAMDPLICLVQLTGISADRLHTSELTWEMIPEGFEPGQPAQMPGPDIALELKKINDQLGEIREMISQLIP